QACQRELTLNRRTAPDIYLGVRRITRHADGHLELNGKGGTVDTIVLMRRFGHRDLLDNLAREGRLTPSLMTNLARLLARFHHGAAVSTDHNGSARLARILDLNAQSEAGTARILASSQPPALGRRLRHELN